MRTMRITQSYNGTVSHKPHWYGSKDYADYPIDIAGNDGGQDIYYATVDMKVTAIKGIGSSMTNTIWLVATSKCKTPSGELTPFIALTHWNDNDPYIKGNSVGSIVKAGEPICQEGVDGATANHLHMVCGNADRGCGDGLIQNSNGKWVSNGYCMKPEQIMYIDKEFTYVADSSDIRFEDKPIEKDFLPDRGYYTEGDSDDNVSLIDDFYSGQVLGEWFGVYTKYLTMAFQDKYNVEGGIDGNIGIHTLNKMKEIGLDKTVKLENNTYYKEGDHGSNM